MSPTRIRWKLWLLQIESTTPTFVWTWSVASVSIFHLSGSCKEIELNIWGKAVGRWPLSGPRRRYGVVLGLSRNSSWAHGFMGCNREIRSAGKSTKKTVLRSSPSKIIVERELIHGFLLLYWYNKYHYPAQWWEKNVVVVDWSCYQRGSKRPTGGWRHRLWGRCQLSWQNRLRCVSVELAWRMEGDEEWSAWGWEVVFRGTRRVSSSKNVDCISWKDGRGLLWRMITDMYLNRVDKLLIT